MTEVLNITTLASKNADQRTTKGLLYRTKVQLFWKIWHVYFLIKLLSWWKIVREHNKADWKNGFSLVARKILFAFYIKVYLDVVVKNFNNLPFYIGSANIPRLVKFSKDKESDHFYRKIDYFSSLLFRLVTFFIQWTFFVVIFHWILPQFITNAIDHVIHESRLQMKMEV